MCFHIFERFASWIQTSGSRMPFNGVAFVSSFEKLEKPAIEKNSKETAMRDGEEMLITPDTMKEVKKMAIKQNRSPEFVVAKGIQIEKWLMKQKENGGRFVLEIGGERRLVDFSLD